MTEPDDAHKPLAETRLETDEVLVDARFHLAAIVESADDAIISKDLNSTVRSWNDAARRLFGYTPGEMIGRSILQVIPKELHYEEDEILRKIRAGERIEHFETKRITKVGEMVDVSVTISPIRDQSGRIVGASKIVRDISDRKRMERLLVQTEKLAATGRMAASIAHEVNNPLEALVNLIFLARQNSPKEGKAHQYLVTAEGELERLSHIARQMLGYYRDTASPTELYLHEAIETVLSVYHSKLLATGIAVEAHWNELSKIVVSQGEMIQVFSNLITNAMDAMRGGGTLHISLGESVGPHGAGIESVIRDHGIGIPPQNLDRIFDPFFTTKGDLGTGIGLWVAKQLVEKRGGQITIESNTEVGQSGTTIMVFLPFAQPIDLQLFQT